MGSAPPLQPCGKGSKDAPKQATDSMGEGVEKLGVVPNDPVLDKVVLQVPIVAERSVEEHPVAEAVKNVAGEHRRIKWGRRQ